MALVRTSKGNMIDMDALAANNKKTVAVSGGGVSMNAQGDILGKGGKIIKTRKDLEAAYTAYTDAHPDGVKKVDIRSKNISPDKFINRRTPVQEPDPILLNMDDVTDILDGKELKEKVNIEKKSSEDPREEITEVKKPVSTRRKTVEDE